jgi:hypothetical protein
MASLSATAFPMTFKLAPHERQKRWSDEDSIPHFGQYINFRLGGIYERHAVKVLVSFHMKL